jgi:hypothetical protein
MINTLGEEKFNVRRFERELIGASAIDLVGD